MFLNCKKLNILFIMILFFTLFLVFSFCFHYSFIFADDVDTTLCYSLKHLFESNNGLYIASTLNRLFGTILPLYFNLHPSEFKSAYFCYFEAIIILLFIFILNLMFAKDFTHKNIELSKMNKISSGQYCIYFLFTTLLLFVFLQRQPYMLFIYDGFFRMLMPVFIWIVLFFFLIRISQEKYCSKQSEQNFFKYINKENFISAINWLCVYVFAFSGCISNEMICISTIFGFFIYFYLTMCHTRLNFTNFKLKLLLLVIGTLISVLGFVIIYKAGAFGRKFDDNIICIDFIYLIKLFPDFLKYYVKYIFINHIIAYFLLAAEILIIYKKKLQDENVNEIIKLIFSFLIGILIFFLLLIGLGKTHWYGDYWICHDDLHVIYSIILCSFNFVLLNIIIKKCKIKKNIILAVLIVLSLFLTYRNFNFYENFLKNDIIPLKMKTYKAEKIIRLADLKNKTAVIDSEILDYGYLWGIFDIPSFVHFGTKENNIYPPSLYVVFLNNATKKKKITNNFMLSDKETVNREFAANGGIFTDEELKNINFNRLLNDNFVLNNSRYAD